MVQFHQVKNEYPDTLLLFRVGDFFETFDEDAKTASKVLGITLTKRSNGAAGDVPLAGFPHHALDTYLPKLVRAGLRVAVCEQTENPKFAKGLVKREVVEIVTPGVAYSDKLLDHKKNNYLAAFSLNGESVGLSFCDISTGEFFTFEIAKSSLAQQLEQMHPVELLTAKRHRDFVNEIIRLIPEPPRISFIEEWILNFDFARESLTLQFGTHSLKGFGIEHLSDGIIAAGAILHYLKETQRANVPHLKKISLYNPDGFMHLDFATRRNLEITFSSNDGGREGSLISILDKTSTPMGARLLKKWISFPLRTLEDIINRQDAVAELKQFSNSRASLFEQLQQIGDVERLISKVCTGRATPREVVHLKNAIKTVPALKTVLMPFSSGFLISIRSELSPLTELCDAIEKTLVDFPPASLVEGGVIRGGFSAELDDLRDISLNGKDWIANYQKSERERTGINSLKVAFNKVFGYYIDISNTHKTKIPENYIRKQTLVNSERYITPELKEYEDKVLNAEEHILSLETQLFNELRLNIVEFTEKIQLNAQLIATLDVLLSFALCAEEYNYSKPTLTEDGGIKITAGRHPVVERILPPGTQFTPNDLELNPETSQIIILTGPNMAGKSVFLRQAGLIVLMAQIGSFIPATSAHISLVDRIFTRVGASDNLTAGESTFLVEMHEAANILNNATDKSLILLDEIGRGTSTFDGISIAWSITEYLHESPYVSAKTIFATHYHELNELAELFPRIKNYKVDVREYGDKVIFLHKVTPGYADHSYGIQVAQMAGLPLAVTKRAKEILANLEGKELTPADEKKAKIRKHIEENYYQLNLFEAQPDPIHKAISDLDINAMTPLEALIKLQELKSKSKN